MIVIAGKNNIAVHALHSLVKQVGNSSIVVLANETDQGIDGWQRSLKLAAQELKVPLSTLSDIQKQPMDLFLSLEFDKIINPEKFTSKNLFNIHFSLLPKYKGMYTSIWPILHGDNEAGVTLHAIDRGIDTGDIYAQKSFLLSETDRSRDLYRKYIENSISLFDETMDLILNSNLSSSQQAANHSTYYSKSSINFHTLAVDTNTTAWQLQRQIYAYSFREYQLPHIHGKPIVDIEITGEKSIFKPGTIVSESKSSMIIATIDYDAILYFDRLDEVLLRIPTCTKEALQTELKNIAGINDRNHKGWSPIIVAAYHGNLEAVEHLLEMGADPNDCNYKGTTVLMYAKDYSLKNRDRSVFDALINMGANPEKMDFSGKKLIDYISTNEANFLGI